MENFTTGVMLGITSSVLISAVGYLGWKYSLFGKSSWRRVGTLEEILFYPLKSGAAVSLGAALCDVHGMQSVDERNLRTQDRCFVVFNPCLNTILTVRDYPQLVLMKWQESGDNYVTFEAPGMPSITVEKPTCVKENRQLCRMWNGDETYVMDFGDEAALWLTNYLQLDVPDLVRLGYFCPKFCQGRNFGTSLQSLREIFPKVCRRDFGIYCDSAPYTLLTDATMDELKKQLGGLESDVDMEWFRPNLVVSNNVEFEEDGWNYIKIGDAIFQNVMPCLRDPSCCVNPSTGRPTADGEPFVTLRKIRCSSSDCMHDERLPAFGIGLGLREMGNVHVGDAVYVSDSLDK